MPVRDLRPSLDALCAQELGFAATIRFAVSVVLIVSALLFTRILNAVTFYLMSRENCATERRGSETRSDPSATAQAQKGNPSGACTHPGP